MTDVRVDVDGSVARITLDRPDRMNAITLALAEELASAMSGLGARHDIHVIAIRGAGTNFCAGGDFDEVQRLRAEGPESLRALFTTFKEACAAIASAPQPVVVAVEGVAMAGGFELMQAADIVLVADDARIADYHVNFGMVPGGGSTARLPRIVGRQQALGLLLSGDRIDGRDAVALGLAYRSYPRDHFDAAVNAFVSGLAARDPRAVRTIKSLVNAGLTTDLDRANTDETDAVVEHIAGQAGVAGVSAFKAREVQT